MLSIAVTKKLCYAIVNFFVNEKGICNPRFACKRSNIKAACKLQA